MRRASNGQRSTHRAQAVQPGASCNTAHLRPPGSPSGGQGWRAYTGGLRALVEIVAETQQRS
jgi:hypothetical protein